MRTLVIQAGGNSQRMRQNKALMSFCGEPLIERVLRRTKDLAEETFITANILEDFQYLGLPIIKDMIPGKGALGGLYTALKSASNQEVIVVGCDMPFVNSKLLIAECDLLDWEIADAVIPVSPFGIEPLHAVYRRDNCLAAVQNALENGHLRLISWFSDVRITKMTSEEVAVYDPEYYAFINVNTPQEFQSAEILAERIG
jgi:molybdopterin-guanine dinucleotide biosynthesis protein A